MLAVLSRERHRLARGRNTGGADGSGRGRRVGGWNALLGAYRRTENLESADDSAGYRPVSNITAETFLGRLGTAGRSQATPRPRTGREYAFSSRSVLDGRAAYRRRRPVHTRSLPLVPSPLSYSYCPRPYSLVGRTLLSLNFS